jgi:alkanesulfonate monooxygenase SsuD/methylene tetrahydromethanopterin reductase-like flavin-dependent oxidoreductase (luciferase family)
MFKGEPVDVHGDRTVTLNPKLVNGPHHIPIYLAAASAPMITLAGEIADGVILSSFFGRHLNYAKRLLEEGVTKAGREKSSVKICNAAYLSVARNSDKAVDLARDICVKLIKGTKFPLLEMCGIDRELYEATLKATREGDFESTRKLMHSGIVDNLVVAGDPNECAKKCNDLFANGVELLLFNQPYGPDKQEALRLIRQYLETGSLMHP